MFGIFPAAKSNSATGCSKHNRKFMQGFKIDAWLVFIFIKDSVYKIWYRSNRLSVLKLHCIPSPINIGYFPFLPLALCIWYGNIIGGIIQVVGIGFSRPRIFVLWTGIAFNQEMFNWRSSVSRPDNIWLLPLGKDLIYRGCYCFLKQPERVSGCLRLGTYG